jgi:hypothetical protein
MLSEASRIDLPVESLTPEQAQARNRLEALRPAEARYIVALGQDAADAIARATLRAVKTIIGHCPLCAVGCYPHLGMAPEECA